MTALAGRRLLSVFGWGNIALAVLHLAIIFVGAPAYRFFGAGERMARNAERGVWLPAAITLALVVLFAAFGWMSLAAGGKVPCSSSVKYWVAAIAVIYLARGCVVAPQAWAFSQDPAQLPVRYLVFSSIALVMGAVAMRGLTLVWREI